MRHPHNYNGGRFLRPYSNGPHRQDYYYGKRNGYNGDSYCNQPPPNRHGDSYYNQPPPNRHRNFNSYSDNNYNPGYGFNANYYLNNNYNYHYNNNYYYPNYYNGSSVPRRGNNKAANFRQPTPHFKTCESTGNPRKPPLLPNPPASVLLEPQQNLKENSLRCEDRSADFPQPSAISTTEADIDDRRENQPGLALNDPRNKRCSDSRANQISSLAISRLCPSSPPTPEKKPEEERKEDDLNSASKNIPSSTTDSQIKACASEQAGSSCTNESKSVEETTDKRAPRQEEIPLEKTKVARTEPNKTNEDQSAGKTVALIENKTSNTSEKMNSSYIQPKFDATFRIPRKSNAASSPTQAPRLPRPFADISDNNNNNTDRTKPTTWLQSAPARRVVKPIILTRKQETWKIESTESLREILDGRQDVNLHTEVKKARQLPSVQNQDSDRKNGHQTSSAKENNFEKSNKNLPKSVKQKDNHNDQSQNKESDNYQLEDALKSLFEREKTVKNREQLFKIAPTGLKDNKEGKSSRKECNNQEKIKEKDEEERRPREKQNSRRRSSEDDKGKEQPPEKRNKKERKSDTKDRSDKKQKTQEEKEKRSKNSSDHGKDLKSKRRRESIDDAASRPKRARSTVEASVNQKNAAEEEDRAPEGKPHSMRTRSPHSVQHHQEESSETTNRRHDLPSSTSTKSGDQRKDQEKDSCVSAASDPKCEKPSRGHPRDRKSRKRSSSGSECSNWTPRRQARRRTSSRPRSQKSKVSERTPKPQAGRASSRTRSQKSEVSERTPKPQAGRASSRPRSQKSEVSDRTPKPQAGRASSRPRSQKSEVSDRTPKPQAGRASSRTRSQKSEVSERTPKPQAGRAGSRPRSQKSEVSDRTPKPQAGRASSRTRSQKSEVSERTPKPQAGRAGSRPRSQKSKVSNRTPKPQARRANSRPRSQKSAGASPSSKKSKDPSLKVNSPAPPSSRVSYGSCVASRTRSKTLSRATRRSESDFSDGEIEKREPFTYWITEKIWEWLGVKDVQLAENDLFLPPENYITPTQHFTDNGNALLSIQENYGGSSPSHTVLCSVVDRHGENAVRQNEDLSYSPRNPPPPTSPVVNNDVLRQVNKEALSNLGETGNKDLIRHENTEIVKRPAVPHSVGDTVPVGPNHVISENVTRPIQNEILSHTPRNPPQTSPVVNNNGFTRNLHKEAMSNLGKTGNKDLIRHENTEIVKRLAVPHSVGDTVPVGPNHVISENVTRPIQNEILSHTPRNPPQTSPVVNNNGFTRNLHKEALSNLGKTGNRDLIRHANTEVVKRPAVPHFVGDTVPGVSSLIKNEMAARPVQNESLSHTLRNPAPTPPAVNNDGFTRNLHKETLSSLGKIGNKDLMRPANTEVLRRSAHNEASVAKPGIKVLSMPVNRPDDNLTKTTKNQGLAKLGNKALNQPLNSEIESIRPAGNVGNKQSEDDILLLYEKFSDCCEMTTFWNSLSATQKRDIDASCGYYHVIEDSLDKFIEQYREIEKVNIYLVRSNSLISHCRAFKSKIFDYFRNFAKSLDELQKKFKLDDIHKLFRSRMEALYRVKDYRIDFIDNVKELHNYIVGSSPKVYCGDVAGSKPLIVLKLLGMIERKMSQDSEKSQKRDITKNLVEERKPSIQNTPTSPRIHQYDGVQKQVSGVNRRSGQPGQPRPLCSLCGSPATLLCRMCKKRTYCDRACQEKDWWKNGHKNSCSTENTDVKTITCVDLDDTDV